MTAAPAYTPPLTIEWLTPLYDRVIALMTREGRWRANLVEQIAPRPGLNILDLGCGTGSLAVALWKACPDLRIIGIDPDAHAVSIAREKTRMAGPAIEILEGFPGSVPLPSGWRPDAVVISLVLHQVPLAGKRDLLAYARSVLPPGGVMHVADYSEQRGVMRAAFRLTVQVLDGVEDTQPNADGALPMLIREAGFELAELDRLSTPTGSLSLFSATPGSQQP